MPHLAPLCFAYLLSRREFRRRQQPVHPEMAQVPPAFAPSSDDPFALEETQRERPDDAGAAVAVTVADGDLAFLANGRDLAQNLLRVLCQFGIGLASDPAHAQH